MVCRDYDRIEVTHVNLKTKVQLMASHIEFFYASDQGRCTNIFCSGQNIFPAEESVEQINKLLDDLTKGE